MRDLGWYCKIRLLVDSSAAKSIASRTGLGKLRHLEIKFLWLQECVRRGKVVLGKVRGDINPADVLTKPKSASEVVVALPARHIHLIAREDGAPTDSVGVARIHLRWRNHCKARGGMIF